MSDVLSKAKLASLSYVHLKKNEESGEILADDILETDDFPHIGNPEDLSKRKRNPQEKMLGEIIDSRPFQTFKDHFDIEKTPAISADSLALISKSSGKSEELIRLQIEKSFLSEEPISEEVIRYFWLNSCIEEMRKKKRSMDSAPIKSMEKQGFKIFDFFPNSEAQDVDESGLGAVALKDKNGKIHIAIRGTEIGRKDGKADYELTRGRIPLRQTRDLVLFIERVLEKAPKNGKISIEGHSLGGALTQIASIMFRERIENAMTFNSPGGANLEIHPENEENPIVRARFEAYQNFTYPIDNNSVENRIVNVG